MGLIFIIAIIGGILWFIRKSSIDKYTQKQELATKILEKANRLRLENLADINELSGQMASADREQYISLTQARESTEAFIRELENCISCLQDILKWRPEPSGGRLEIQNAIFALQRQTGYTLEELAQELGVK
mgnify:FL=1